MPVATSVTAPPGYTGFTSGTVSPAQMRALLGLEGGINVTDPVFGAIGNGIADDRPAIQAAINYVAGLGGGTVYLPAGTYLVTDGGGEVALSVPSFVSIVGASRSATVIKLASGANAHVINFIDGVFDVGVYNLTVDGNRVAQSADVHGIRTTVVTRLVISNVRVTNATGYGIGLQGGKKTDVQIDNVHVDGSGSDGIDIKNTADNNLTVRLSDIFIRAHGQNSLLTSQTGIDVRGPAALSNIVVSNVGTGPAGTVGIRFRAGEIGDPSGYGGHLSTLSGFHIEGAGVGTIGVFLAARRCAIGNGVIENVEIGCYVSQADNVLTGLQASACSADGFQVYNSAEATNGDRNALAGCIARSCGGDGFVIQGDENTLSSCIARSCGADGFILSGDENQLMGCETRSCGGVGFVISSGSENCLTGGVSSGNVTAAVTDAGSGTKISSVIGIITSARVLSGTVAIGSTGLKTATITHGLAFTPAIQECELTLTKDTAVTDFTVSFLRVAATSSTTVTAEVFVSVASATGAATAKIALSVRTKG